KIVLRKRLSGKPVSKIFNVVYFYGLSLKINNNVLSPRQETEILVNEALKAIKSENKVLDLCTGSGAIALAIKENIDCEVIASDISFKALKIAEYNVKKFKQNIRLVHSDLFSNINEKFDVIVSNPPYISLSEMKELDDEVKKYDPIISLYGGEDGLDFYRQIIKEAKNHLTCNGTILFEIGYRQGESVKNLLENEGFCVKVVQDFEKRDRVVIGKLKI
ncbi:MAG: peptide chain release factor N(5)-glutamine methyltransferase, partial [Clostridiales bacterium]|nr:peptide chain release factor N(5)-glutamine methyltransferase [Candidatus Apopatousia equi]